MTAIDHLPRPECAECARGTKHDHTALNRETFDADFAPQVECRACGAIVADTAAVPVSIPGRPDEPADGHYLCASCAEEGE